MPEVAERIYHDLRARVGPSQYDAKQSIGKRYARMDEAGTPFCITVDGQTLTDQTVTVRDRDTGAQVRVATDHVGASGAERVQNRADGGVSRELHAASVPRGGCGGSRGIPRPRISTPTGFATSLMPSRRRSRP